MCANPDVTTYLGTYHVHIWSRSVFYEICKVDYINNNLVESFNSKIKKLKFLSVVDLLEKIMQ